MALPPPDPARRARLNAVKLAALVRDHANAAGEPAAFGAGAALLVGDVAWVLVDGTPVAPLGAALAWATARRVAHLHVLADDERVAGRLARRAGLVDLDVTAWRVDGRALVAARPAPLPAPFPVDGRCAELQGVRLGQVLRSGDRGTPDQGGGVLVVRRVGRHLSR